MHCMQLYANVKYESAFAHSSSMDACIEVSPSQVLAPDPRARANQWKLSVFVPGDPVGATCFRTQFWQSPAHCIARNVERSNRKWPSIGYTHVHAKYSFSQPLEAFQRMSTGQARCVVVTGCMHFNFHQNGKCELAPGSFGLNYWTELRERWWLGVLPGSLFFAWEFRDLLAKENHRSTMKYQLISRSISYLFQGIQPESQGLDVHRFNRAIGQSQGSASRLSRRQNSASWQRGD